MSSSTGSTDVHMDGQEDGSRKAVSEPGTNPQDVHLGEEKQEEEEEEEQEDDDMTEPIQRMASECSELFRICFGRFPVPRDSDQIESNAQGRESKGSDDWCDASMISETTQMRYTFRDSANHDSSDQGLGTQPTYEASQFLREYDSRFIAWCSFMSVFAGSEACLDHKLRDHSALQDMILRLLDVLRRNLYLSKLNFLFPQLVCGYGLTSKSDCL